MQITNYEIEKEIFQALEVCSVTQIFMLCENVLKKCEPKLGPSKFKYVVASAEEKVNRI